MHALETLLKARDIEFDANNRRIMCFAHVVNLCSGRVIRGVAKEVAAEDSEDTSSESDANSPASDPIARARAAVRAVRASGAHRDAFNKAIKNGNAEGWFTSGKATVKVQPLQLLRDVPTRWDSVYSMLRRLYEMRPVCLFSSNETPAN